MEEAIRIRRHRVAERQAMNADRKWFARNPFQSLHLRDSIAFEHPDWDAEGHVRNPFVLVFYDADAGIIDRRPFYAHERPKDDTATLLALLEQLEKVDARRASGGSGAFTKAEGEAVEFPRMELASLGARLDSSLDRLTRRRRRAMIAEEMLK